MLTKNDLQEIRIQMKWELRPVKTHLRKIDGHLRKVDGHLREIDSHLRKVDNRLTRIDSNIHSLTRLNDFSGKRVNNHEKRIQRVETHLNLPEFPSSV